MTSPKRCLHCGSRDFEVEYENDGDDIEQCCTCGECGARWINKFEFVTYEIVET